MIRITTFTRIGKLFIGDSFISLFGISLHPVDGTTVVVVVIINVMT